MEKELVSVVMCTYNGSAFIGEQVESILNQSYRNIELIAGDDASTDESFALLLKYASRDPRVKPYRNEKNLGYNLNFSIACSKARGGFIAISDQDDIWEEEKISILLHRLAEKESNVLVHGISARFEERNKPHLRSLRLVNYLEGHDIRRFFMLNIISGHNMLFRSSLLKKSLPFPEKVYYDWWLAANCCVVGEIVAEKKILVWHRMHASNATGAAKPKILFYRQIQIILPAILGIEGIDPKHRKFGEELLRHYLVFPQKNFSLSLFWFLLRNARIVFAHKKRVFPWISYLKHSFKYSKRNTKA
ncbi:MAG: glycosyltransferase [Flavisolibacter sp.]